MKIKRSGKVVLVAAVFGVVAYVATVASNNGYFKQKVRVESSIPPKVDIPQNPIQVPTQVSAVETVPSSSSYEVRILTIPWNAVQGLLFANGDAVTAKGSLMEQRGVKVRVERQDDYSQMITEQLAFAKQVANGSRNPSKGAAFVVIMGDGYPAYVAGVKESFAKEAPGQSVEVVGAVGYSRGEDQCLLPPEVKSDPKKAKGSLVGAVLRDGDWNICVKWASDNDIPINPDEKTYNPDAMNFIAVSAFTEADEKLIGGYCENRLNLKTNQKERVCQNGTATWTPGDVKVAREVGKVVPVASTREYLWQMPATLIGNKQWMAENRDLVENLLAAAFTGGEIVRSNDDALSKSSRIAAKVFKEQDAEYWKKYFKGTSEVNKTGQRVSLGGSTTNGLGDNAYLFGLQGNFNLYKSVYNIYGSIASKYYPDVMPKVEKYETVVNTTYLESLLSKSKLVAVPEKPTYSLQDKATGVFASKSYSVEFEFNKATFTPQARVVLEDMLNQLSVAGLRVQVNGHTDSIGSTDANLLLSRKRAEAVKNWIVTNAQSAFPNDRIVVRGYGDTNPVADNKTDSGRAKNRRVEIQLVQTN